MPRQDPELTCHTDHHFSTEESSFPSEESSSFSEESSFSSEESSFPSEESFFLAKNLHFYIELTGHDELAFFIIKPSFC